MKPNAKCAYRDVRDLAMACLLVLAVICSVSAQELPKEQKTFYVKEIRFQGGEDLISDGLMDIANTYLHKALITWDLVELRQKLSRYIVAQGFINSGVVVPPQTIEEGVLILQLVAGELSDIQVKKNENVPTDYIIKTIHKNVSTPLNVEDLHRAIKLLQLDPLVSRLMTHLKPAMEKGKADLSVNVEETDPYHASIDINNHRSPSTGAEQIRLVLSHLSLSGNRDILRADVGKSEGGFNGGLSYSYPLLTTDSRLEAAYEYSDSEVIEAPFNAVDIENEVERYSLLLSHPLFVDLSERFILEGKIDHQRSKSELLGKPFPFSPGAIDGKAEVTAFEMALHWTLQRKSSAFAAKLAVRTGVDLGLDRTENHNLPDSEFTSWIMQVAFGHHFAWFNYVLQVDLQMTDDSLLPLEKFAVGGANTVRGYRENAFLRDNGVVSSLELYLPVGKLLDFDSQQLQAVLFYDYGQTWDHDSDLTGSEDSINSAGFGVIWNPTTLLRLEVYAAQAFDEIEYQEYDLQNDGIHFRMTYDLPL